MCNGNPPIPKVIGTVVGSQPLLLAASVEISFSTAGRALLTMREIQRSNPIRDIAFFGSKICSTVTLAHFLRIFLILLCDKISLNIDLISSSISGKNSKRENPIECLSSLICIYLLLSLY